MNIRMAVSQANRSNFYDDPFSTRNAQIKQRLCRLLLKHERISLSLTSRSFLFQAKSNAIIPYLHPQNETYDNDKW